MIFDAILASLAPSKGREIRRPKVADDPKEPDPKPGDDPKPGPEPDPKPDPKDDEPFDKDRALATIKKQRESEDAAKKRAAELEAKIKEFEDRDKTEQQRTAEAKEAAVKEAAAAKSEVVALRMAIKYGLDEEDLDLLGTGTAEQIEARAKRLSERGAAKDDDTRRRPRERLKAGAAPGAEPDEDDPKKLAAAVPRGW